MTDEAKGLPEEMKEVVARFTETATMPKDLQEKPAQSFPWSAENLPQEGSGDE